MPHMHAAIDDLRSGIRCKAGTKSVMEFGKQAGHDGRQIDHVVAGKAAGDFLQADDVGIAEFGCNALRIVFTVESDAKLNVITRNFHDIL